MRLPLGVFGVPESARADRGTCQLLTDQPGGLCLAAGGGVLVQGALGRGLVEPADELRVARADGLGVAALGGFLEAAHERLRRGAPAQVLDPLPGREANALLLLSDVRHRRENAR